MGHLVNPTAFRLGHFISWEDKWYVKHIYYPEYLHSVLKLRSYLYFFFNFKRIERHGILFSHFEIVKINKNFVVKIFIYHSKLEYLNYDFISGCLQDFKSYLRKVYYRRFIESKYKLWDINLRFSIMIFFIIFLFFFNLNEGQHIFEESKRAIEKPFIRRFIKDKKFYKKFIQPLRKKQDLKRSKVLKKLAVFEANEVELKATFPSKENIAPGLLAFDILHFLSIVKFYNSRSFFKYLNQFLLKYDKFFNLTRSKILIFFTVLRLFVKNINKSLQYSHVGKMAVLKSWFNILVNLKYLKPTFSLIYKFLINLLCIIVKMENMLIRFYIISNANVGAKFVVRFIARKLRRNFTVFQVVKPLRKELSRLILPDKKKYIIKRNMFLKHKLRGLQISNFYKGLFRHLCSILKQEFNKEHYILFKLYKTFYDFQVFFFYFNLKKEFKKEDRRLHNIKFFFFKHKMYMYFFYNLNFFFFQTLFLSSFIKKKDLEISKNINLNLIYDKIFCFFSLNSILFKTRNLYLNNKAFISSFYYLTKLIKYNFINFNFKRLNCFNNLKKRIHYKENWKKKRGILVGFKMAFYGRFTRKQRAASMWFAEGKLPLNTVTTKVDYAFYTIPLKNSAVGIKVWLNRNKKRNYEWLYKVPANIDNSK